MFTIKVMRRAGDGDEKQNLYCTPAPVIMIRQRGPGLSPERVVTWRDPGTDEWPAVVLNPEDVVEPRDDEYVAHTVVIENAQGKTTEVVRA